VAAEALTRDEWDSLDTEDLRMLLVDEYADTGKGADPVAMEYGTSFNQ
jgi:hypothetical protein